MTKENPKDMEEQILGPFIKSFHRRYERWQKKDLLLVAHQTFPKQVRKERVSDNLKGLRAEFKKKLSDER